MSKFAPVLEALGKEGWLVKPLELASDCRWAKDIWELRSRSTPTDAKIYLCLLVDPMDEIDRINVPDASVWAVGISESIPPNRSSAEKFLVPINRRMQEAVPEIVAETGKLRMAR